MVRIYSGTSTYRSAKGLAKFVRYNEVLFHIFYYNWGKKKIVRYTEDLCRELESYRSCFREKVVPGRRPRIHYQSSQLNAAQSLFVSLSPS